MAIPEARDRLRVTVETLASLGSRLSGHEGAGRAADWLEAQLAALDLGQVRREQDVLCVGRARLRAVHELNERHRGPGEEDERQHHLQQREPRLAAASRHGKGGRCSDEGLRTPHSELRTA